MELNEIHTEHEHATTSMKVLLLVFSLVVIGALSYMVAMNNQAEDTDSAAPAVKNVTTEQETASAETVEALKCGDTDLYGFSMTFGEKWTGYKIKEVKSNEAVITCYFTMPTTSTEETWTVAATDHDAKYASLFAVSVYTPAQWAVAKAEANTPTQLASTTDYVWAWLPAQAYPDDLAAVAADDDNVIATFVLAN